jgi:hypothetical protein
MTALILDPMFRSLIAKLHNAGYRLKSLVAVFNLDPKTIRSWRTTLKSRLPQKSKLLSRCAEDAVPTSRATWDATGKGLYRLPPKNGSVCVSTGSVVSLYVENTFVRVASGFCFGRTPPPFPNRITAIHGLTKHRRLAKDGEQFVLYDEPLALVEEKDPVTDVSKYSAASPSFRIVKHHETELGQILALALGLGFQNNRSIPDSVELARRVSDELRRLECVAYLDLREIAASHLHFNLPHGNVSMEDADNVLGLCVREFGASLRQVSRKDYVLMFVNGSFLMVGSV